MTPNPPQGKPVAKSRGRSWARSVWSARSLLPLSEPPRLTIAPASWTHSKRFALQECPSFPTSPYLRPHTLARQTGPVPTPAEFTRSIRQQERNRLPAMPAIAGKIRSVNGHDAAVLGLLAHVCRRQIIARRSAWPSERSPRWRGRRVHADITQQIIPGRPLPGVYCLASTPHGLASRLAELLASRVQGVHTGSTRDAQGFFPCASGEHPLCTSCTRPIGASSHAWDDGYTGDWCPTRRSPGSRLGGMKHAASELWEACLKSGQSDAARGVGPLAEENSLAQRCGKKPRCAPNGLGFWMLHSPLRP